MGGGSEKVRGRDLLLLVRVALLRQQEEQGRLSGAAVSAAVLRGVGHCPEDYDTSSPEARVQVKLAE